MVSQWDEQMCFRAVSEWGKLTSATNTRGIKTVNQWSKMKEDVIKAKFVNVICEMYSEYR